jgi:CheY-like chemotaxis protein
MNRPPVILPVAGLRVLVVDDDPRVRAAMATELTAVGWHPTALGPEWLPGQDAGPRTGPSTGNGDLASEFDVVLIDVALPTVAHGLELITRLVTQLPVVAFSINGAARTAALDAGAASYLEKDGDTDRLLHALHSATSASTLTCHPIHPPSRLTGPRPSRSSR